MSWLLPVVYTAVVWALWKAISLLRNLRTVRRLGLPILVQFYDPHPILLLLWVFYVRLVNTFGSTLSSRSRGESSIDKKRNDVFFKVYPSSIELIINDPECASNVLSRRNDFIKLAEIAEKLNIFGPSVQTAEGDQWQRHRKITAPSFNERVSSSVWVESLEQARKVLASWEKGSRSGTRTVATDVNRLTVRVFSFAGIGIKHTDAEDQQLILGHSMAYADALTLILDNLIFLALLPALFFTFTMLPARLHELGTATTEFKKYMEDIVNDERGLVSKDNEIHQGGRVHNLANALIQASETAKLSDEGRHAIRGLSDDEIYGNLFIYNVAGYATTAGAITYAIALLAAYPQWQEWIAEELNELGERDSSIEKYEETFPRLKRCLAVMFETLRLYPPAIAVPKRVGPQSQIIHVQQKPYVIPPNTYVTIASEALQCDPAHWGPDAYTWRPSRWLRRTADESTADVPSASSAAKEAGTQNGAENLIEPRKGTYMPWSDGPRVCPGRKFSQVEFVAVMAALFRRHWVQPKLMDGESLEEGQARVLRMIGRRDLLALTTQMERPDEVAMVWSERSKEETSRT